MKDNDRKTPLNPVVLRYILSYLVILLLPLLLFHLVFYPRIVGMLSQNELRGEEQRMVIVREDIHNRFSSLYEYSQLFYTSSDIVGYILQEDTPVNRTKIINELRSSFMSNGYDMVFFFNPSNERVYTSTSSYKTGWLNKAGSQLYVEERPGSALYEMLNEAKRLTVYGGSAVYLSGIRHDSTLLYLPTYGNYGSLLFVLDTSELLLLSDEQNTSRFLIDPNGKVLSGMSAGDSCPVIGLDVPDIIAELGGKDSGLIHLNGSQYVVTVNPIKDYDLRLVSLTPQEYLYAKLNTIQRWYYVMMALVSLVSLVLMSFFTRMHYKPISQMRERLTGLRQTGGILPPLVNRQNDWKVIMDALDDRDDEYSEANRRYLTLASNSRQYFLFRYLYDGVGSEQEILDTARLYELDIRDQILCVAFSVSGAAENPEEARGLLRGIQQINQEDPSSASCYIISGFGFVTFYVLLFFDREEELKPYFYRFYNLPEGVKGGIGTYQSITEPGKSRSMAIAALEMSLMSDTLHIATQEDISIQESDLNRKLYDSLQNLELSIMRSRRDQVQENFSELLSLAFDKPDRYYIASNAYVNIYNTLVNCFNTLRSRRTLPVAPMEHIYSEYSVPHGVYEMRLSLETLKNQIISVLETSYDSRDDSDYGERVRELLDYIDKNHTDPNLSLTSVSEHFGFSYSNLSHWIRSHAGITFTGYLDKLRIEHAKELLAASSFTIDQVASQVGYTNASTFTRSFKKYEKISPGQYRRNVGGKD